MTNSDFAVSRGQQVVSLLLSAVPLAERMLLYSVGMTAWMMLADRLHSQPSPRQS
jgi:hypothetical protein